MTKIRSKQELKIIPLQTQGEFYMKKMENQADKNNQQTNNSDEQQTTPAV